MDNDLFRSTLSNQIEKILNSKILELKRSIKEKSLTLSFKQQENVIIRILQTICN
jgi:hypothetical protein